MRHCRRNLCCLLLAVQLPLGVAMADESAPASRQDEVARKGAGVMPFDLRRTTHHFDDTPTGGIETVTANDHGDAEQVRLIRAHLAHEATRFAQGDFSDPARIHGEDMPGLAKSVGKFPTRFCQVPLRPTVPPKLQRSRPPTWRKPRASS